QPMTERSPYGREFGLGCDRAWVGGANLGDDGLQHLRVEGVDAGLLSVGVVLSQKPEAGAGPLAGLEDLDELGIGQSGVVRHRLGKPPSQCRGPALVPVGPISRRSARA